MPALLPTSPLTRSARPPAPRRLAAGAVIALLFPALAACGGGDTDTAAAAGTGVGGAEGATQTLRVGQLGASLVNEALLEASGADEGLEYEVEYSLFPTGGPGFMEAVPSDSVDVALMADTPPIFAQVAQVPVKIVGVSTSVVRDASTVQIFAPEGSDIETTADLEGKKVGLTEATILQYTVVQALEEAGLSYGDITPINLPPADAITAYQGGDVDAVAALGPQLAQLTVAGDRVVGDGVGTTSGYQIAVATEAALADEETSALVLDYLQRIQEAQEWARQNPEEWTAIYAKTLGVPEEIAAVLVERESYEWLPIDDEVIAAQQEQADAYTELGLIPEQLDASLQFDDRFNDELVG